MSEPLTLPERAGRAAVWNVLALGTLAVLTFATGILIARTLSKEEYAAYGLFVALVAGILAAVDLGLSASVPKFAAAASAEGGRRGLVRLLALMAGIKLALLGLLGVLVFVAGGPVARFLGIPEGVPTGFLAAVLAIACLDLLAEVFQQGLATVFAQGTLSGIRVAESITLSGLTIALVLLGRGVEGILWAFAGASTLKLLLSAGGLGLRIRSLRTDLTPSPLAPVLPRLARHAATFYAAKWGAYLAGPAFAVVVLRKTCGHEVVADFSLAADLAFRILELAIAPVNSLLLPIFAHLVLAPDRGPVRRAFGALMKVYGIVLLPAAAGLGVLAPLLFRVLYTERYADAAAYFQVLYGLVSLDIVFYSVASSAMISAERYGAFLCSRAPIVLAAVGAVVLVPAIGPLATVAVLAGSRVVAVALLVRSARRLIEAQVPAGFMLRQGAIAAVAAALLWAGVRALPSSAWVLAAAIPAYAIVVLGALKATGGIGAEDRAALADMRIPFKRVLLWLF